MSRKYHCLIAGLPDLSFSESRLPLNMLDFRSYLEEVLHPDDLKLIRLFYTRYDNNNLLAILTNSGAPMNPLGNLSGEVWEEIFLRIKEETYKAGTAGHPPYFGKFINAYREESPLFPGKSWEMQLSQLYYDHVSASSNKFISSWFRFERDLLNIITASQCRKYSVPIESQLNGSDELTGLLSKSNARDFGLDNEFPFFDQIMKAVEEKDIKEFEKKIDRIKWDYLDNETLFRYFTIEVVFTFLIKLSIVERWFTLDRKTGLELFRKLVGSLESSYTFTDEFKLKK